jgi:hypothetical protein
MGSRLISGHRMTRTIGAVVGAAAGFSMLTGCGGSGSTSAVSSATVTDHVHAAVESVSPTGIMLATHYGLLTSTDAGRSWHTDSGLGYDMVGGLLHAHGSYVAAMLPDSAATPSASTAHAPAVQVSTDGKTWAVATGIPAGATVTSLVQGAGRGVWAAVLGVGVFHSGDEGRHWQVAVPAKVPITTLAVVGANLVLATDSGILVTGTSSPSMPALPQLAATVDDLEVSSQCARCLVATLARGGVATSDDGGVSWARHSFRVAFESVAAPAGAPGVLIGMSPSPSARSQGLWRSTDNGVHWHRVLSAPLIDHLYDVPASGSRGSELLAFQWGIQVWSSRDGGRTWQRAARAGGVPTGAAMAATEP